MASHSFAGDLQRESCGTKIELEEPTASVNNVDDDGPLQLLNYFPDVPHFLEATTYLISKGSLCVGFLDSLASQAEDQFDESGEVQYLEIAIQIQSTVLELLPPQNLPGGITTASANARTSFAHYLERHGPVIDVESAKACMAELGKLVPESSTSRSLCLTNLGALLRTRFELTEQKTDIDLAIKHQTESVELCSPESDTKATALRELGISFLSRFQRLGDLTDLDSAIEHQSAAVSLTPSTHTSRIGRLGNLATSLRFRFELTGSAADLDLAISLQKEAIQLTPPTSASRATRLSNLGTLLNTRFNRSGDIKDIDEAVDAFTAAVSLTSNVFLKCGYLSNLTASLTDRFQYSGDVADLDSAVIYQTELVKLTPENHPNKVKQLNNVGNTLALRFERYGAREDIDAAVEFLSEARDMSSSSNNDSIVIASSLARSLRIRYDWFGGLADLDAAVEHATKALDAVSLDSPSRPAFLDRAGVALLTRFNRTGNVLDLQTAIKYQSICVDISLTDKERPAHLTNLGNSLLARFNLFGNTNDLDLAITYQLQAVDLTQVSSAEKPPRMDNAGQALLTRFQSSGKIADIDSAVRYLMESIKLTPLENIHRVSSTNNLGNALLTRYLWLGNVADLTLAIEHHADAVKRAAADNIERGKFLNSLAISLYYRFQRLKNDEDLDSAVALQKECVEATPFDSAMRPSYLHNLGNLLSSRFDHFADATDITAALSTHEEAVKLTPAHSIHMARHLNSLALALRSRYQHLGEITDIDSAIAHYTEAINIIPADSPIRSPCLCNLGDAFESRFEMFGDQNDYEQAVANFRLAARSTTGQAFHRMNAVLRWASITREYDLHSTCEAYDVAFQLLPEVVWIGLNAESQIQQLALRIKSIACDAAACMLTLGEDEPESRQHYYGRAIEVLDHGRSILWSQTSDLKPDLEALRHVDAELADELEHVGRFLVQNLFSDSDQLMPEADASLYRSQAGVWEKLVHRTRQLSGFETFLLPLPIKELRQAAQDGPIILVNISLYRCDAIIMTHQGDLSAVALSDSISDFEELVVTLHRTFGVDIITTSPEEVLPPAPSERDVLNRLWDMLGKPIVSELEVMHALPTSRRVWWCLAGLSTFLPVHAAHSIDEGYGILDIMISSYTPTIAALLNARKARSTSFGMLAVGISDACEGFPKLPSVKKEMRMIRGLVDASILMNSEATVEAVSTGLSICSWVHFSCHGVQDHDMPLYSGFVLHDSRLRLPSISRLSLRHADFAYLSCCETATGTSNLPNESLHLVASMQFAGFRSVIGSTWSVQDHAAMQVANRVYKALFKDGTEQADSSKAAVALHRAVLQLRNKMPPSAWVPFVHFGI